MEFSIYKIYILISTSQGCRDLKYFDKDNFWAKYICIALAGLAQLLEQQPSDQRVADLIPCQRYVP